MKTAAKVAWVAIALGFLAFGLIRLGVGTAMMGQVSGLWFVSELSEGVDDVVAFLAKTEGNRIIAFSAFGYFAYIAAMGLTKIAGAAGSLMSQGWGPKLLAVYLAMHGALFLNFLTVNPKIFLFLGGIAALVAMVWLQRYYARAD